MSRTRKTRRFHRRRLGRTRHGGGDAAPGAPDAPAGVAAAPGAPGHGLPQNILEEIANKAGWYKDGVANDGTPKYTNLIISNLVWKADPHGRLPNTDTVHDDIMSATNAVSAAIREAEAVQRMGRGSRKHRRRRRHHTTRKRHKHRKRRKHRKHPRRRRTARKPRRRRRAKHRRRHGS